MRYKWIFNHDELSLCQRLDAIMLHYEITSVIPTQYIDRGDGMQYIYEAIIIYKK